MALAAGALLATLAWCLWFFSHAKRLEPAMLLVFVVAFVVWLVGAVMLGAPLWAWFERKGWTSLGHALLLASTIGFLVALALQTDLFGLFRPALEPGSHSSYGDGGGTIEVDGVLTPHGWWVALESSARIAAASATGAVATWWLDHGPGRR
jgi:hypothetical protein